MRYIYYILLLALLLFSYGCSKITPSIMLKTGKNYKYSAFHDTLFTSKEYKLFRNDNFEFRIFSNDGFKLIDQSSTGVGFSVNNGTNYSQYTIDYDGYTKLPILGRIKLAGLTIRQAEFLLEEKYSSYYVKPYVLIRINNRRVIVYPGDAGSARVVPLMNNNTRLIEAIATAGGLTQGGKAYKIKLIRGDLQAPEVYLIDLSKIEGIKQADMVLQGNDIIYVEPRKYISKQLASEITPYLTLITTVSFFITFYVNIKRNS